MSQPGWYDDPQHAGMLRYWDGAAWTEHREPKPTAPHQASTPPAAPHHGGQYPGGYQYQGSPYAGGNRYQGTPYQGAGFNPPRKKSGGPVIAMVLVVGLVIVTGLIWQVVRSVSDLTGTAGGGTPSTSSSAGADEVPIYILGERPGWPELSDHVETMHQKYSDALADGSITKYVPDTDEGIAYAQAFVYILTDYKVALMWMGATASTEPSDLDNQIAGFRSEVDGYEARFLAGEDLGATVRIVHEDGTVFESEGVGPELVFDDPEEFAQNYRAQPNANGSYADAAAELAAGFGLSVTYNYAPGADGCLPSKHALENIAAVFCPASPDLIWVNPEYRDYPDSVYREEFIHMIRHEIGHHQILDLCGTIAPPIALDVWEGVTNAYAVLYLGADQELLGGIDGTYTMTDETFEMAEAIHAGTCS